jgi:hypothetical protein
MAVAVIPGVGIGAIRVAAVVPAVVIVLFLGPLWLVGLVCADGRRAYVEAVSARALLAVEMLLGSSNGVRSR